VRSSFGKAEGFRKPGGGGLHKTSSTSSSSSPSLDASLSFPATWVVPLACLAGLISLEALGEGGGGCLH